MSSNEQEENPSASKRQRSKKQKRASPAPAPANQVNVVFPQDQLPATATIERVLLQRLLDDLNTMIADVIKYSQQISDNYKIEIESIINKGFKIERVLLEGFRADLKTAVADVIKYSQQISDIYKIEIESIINKRFKSKKQKRASPAPANQVDVGVPQDQLPATATTERVLLEGFLAVLKTAVADVISDSQQMFDSYKIEVELIINKRFKSNSEQ
jgi:hypothetical protein